jgi:peptide/nickel transport system ATP-binding protein
VEYQLSIKDLHTCFKTPEGVLEAVSGVSLNIPKRKTYGIVGESGCGKSITSLSILRLLPKNGYITSGNILFDLEGKEMELTTLDPSGPIIRSIRGRHISMVFQEPMTSFSPVLTIGSQVSEVIRLHQGCDKKEARDRSIAMFRRVGLSRPEQSFDSYPFNLSGGMRQRSMIAMALSCNPALVIADEPTSALDVTIQKQILHLFSELQEELGMAIMLITHDLGVIAESAEYLTVMYLGMDVETGPVKSVFSKPLHPYTQGLLASIPKPNHPLGEPLVPIPGTVPSLVDRPKGCPFYSRCPKRLPGICELKRPMPMQMEEGRSVRCFLYTHQEEA